MKDQYYAIALQVVLLVIMLAILWKVRKVAALQVKVFKANQKLLEEIKAHGGQGTTNDPRVVIDFWLPEEVPDIKRRNAARMPTIEIDKPDRVETLL